MKKTESKWKWFGHAGHLCVGHACRFHLCTKVGKYLVSTVGEYYGHPEAEKPQEIGYGRLFETMVFRAGKPCALAECGCGLPEISGSEIDFGAYNKAGDAARGHMKMCRKYARKP